MGKSIWIHASIRGCQFVSGRLNLEIVCGHHSATGEAVHSHAVDLRELKSVACFTKGMINSSQNALVQIADGWAPIGKLSSRFDFRHGVSIRRIINDFSRDGDIECVDSRDDAEKLCLLSQRFPCCSLSLMEIAQANGFNVDRISSRALRSLKNAIDSRIEKRQIGIEDLKLDDTIKTMILAGK